MYEQIIECCPFCGYENDFTWNVTKQGYTFHCAECGKTIAICSECKNECDFSHKTNSCSLLKRKQKTVDKTEKKDYYLKGEINMNNTTMFKKFNAKGLAQFIYDNYNKKEFDFYTICREAEELSCNLNIQFKAECEAIYGIKIIELFDDSIIIGNYYGGGYAYCKSIFADSIKEDILDFCKEFFEFIETESIYLEIKE